MRKRFLMVQLNKDGTSEQARWHLLLALSSYYPQKTDPLLEARRYYKQALENLGGGPVAHLIIKRYAKARVEPSSIDLPLLDFNHESIPESLWLALGDWAQVNGLMARVGKRIEVRQPPPWVAKYGATILSRGVESLEDVKKACEEMAMTSAISFWPHEQRDLSASYPDPPDIVYLPQFYRSKTQYIDEVKSKLEKYVYDIQGHYENLGRPRCIEKKLLRRDSLWLAWHLAEELGVPAITERAAKDGDGSEDPRTVQAALFGKDGVAELTGFCKKMK